MPIGEAVLGSVVDFGLDQLSGAIAGGRAKKQFERIAKYNHPREQMQRLQEAGLNPNLVYGGSSGGTAGSVGSHPTSSTPNTSRYQDARLKSAQTDLVQLNRDIAVQKLAQQRIATEAQKSVHDIMKSHPDRIVSVQSPDGGSIEITQPSQLDRYQTQALARHQIVLSDKEIREVERMVKGELSMDQGFANLMRTRQLNETEKQRTQAMLNNNRLWEAIDDLVRSSANPSDVLGLMMKMLITSATGQK